MLQTVSLQRLKADEEAAGADIQYGCQETGSEAFVPLELRDKEQITGQL